MKELTGEEIEKIAANAINLSKKHGADTNKLSRMLEKKYGVSKKNDKTPIDWNNELCLADLYWGI